MAWQKKTGTSSLLPKAKGASPLAIVSSGLTSLAAQSSSPSAFVESVPTPTSLDVRIAAASNLLPSSQVLSGLKDVTPCWYALVIDEAIDQVVALDGSYVIVGDEYLDLSGQETPGLLKKVQGATVWQRLP